MLRMLQQEGKFTLLRMTVGLSHVVLIYLAGR
ncbi:MAG: hypothetical protein JWQ14_2722 [Adhaeribacter sp.]|jgi:hypothetical protein|nr:hypothetical protein [Adhaeribacter sp.]